MNKALKALTPLEALEKIKYYDKYFFADEEWAKEYFNLIETALKRLKKQDYAIRDLMANHIELVVEKDRAYFKIKNSKGKEKSFTSYEFIDFWKEALL